MSALGSLPTFMFNTEIFTHSTDHAYKSKDRNQAYSSNQSPRLKKSTLLTDEIKDKCSSIIQLDQRPEGYTYVSSHKDIEAIIRVSSAAATQRSVHKRPETKSTNRQKIIVSKVASRRNPNELGPPIQKSVKMQEKIRNELMMKNNHYLMRSMRKNLRDDEKKANESFGESTGLFNRLINTVLDDTAQPKPIRFKKIVETEKVVQKHSEAAEKTVRASNDAWMKKRGSFDELKDNNTARVIFKMLDSESRGEINGEELIKFLMEIGIALQPQKIKDILLSTLRKEHSEFKIKYDDINILYKGDHKTNLIMKYLNEEAQEERINKAEGIKIDDSIISIGEHFAILQSWWSFLDKDIRNQVHVNLVAEFLVVKSIVGDSHEGRKVVKEVVNDAQFIDKEQFFCIFARSMIRWVLINLHRKFTEDEWKNPDYSPALKISCLKRNLIMAGLKCSKPGVSQEEGSVVISAIEKYKRFENKPIAKVDFNEFAEYWSEVVCARREVDKPKSRLKINSLQKIMDSDRHVVVRTSRVEAENIFFNDFQKLVNSHK